MFQYMARHSPLKVEDLASMISHENQQDKPLEVEMSDWRVLFGHCVVFFANRETNSQKLAHLMASHTQWLCLY